MQRIPWKSEDCPVLVAGPYKVKLAKPAIRKAFEEQAKVGTADTKDFYRAKYNCDAEAALEVATRTLDTLYLTRMKLMLASLQCTGEKPPILIVPRKPDSQNVLAVSAAHYLAKELGLEVDADIYETTNVSRKSLTKLDKLIHLPHFTGNVQAGRSYIAVDDMVRSGGTFAEMRSHIERNGGRFLFACSMASSSGKDHILNSTESHIIPLLNAIGSDIAAWFEQRTGNPLDTLTASETYILSSPVVREQISLTANF